jgi:beta-mannosidase
MSPDPALVLRDGWQVAAAAPGAAAHPDDLDALGPRWIDAVVPGTAAAAVRAADGDDAARAIDYDAHDWWWRTSVHVVEPGAYRLRLDGVATVSDVWIDGAHAVSSASMLRGFSTDVGLPVGEHVVVIRCAALSPLLEEKRPRARWRTNLVSPGNLRWFRTTALGRMPTLAPHHAPVGPWRPVLLQPLDHPYVVRRDLRTQQVDGGWQVRVEAVIARTEEDDAVATVRAGAGWVEVAVTGKECVLAVDVDVPDAALWWPAGYGDQPLYDVAVDLDGHRHDLGRAGFRTVELDDPTGLLSLRVNGIPMVARGAVWSPPDVVGLSDDGVVEQLERLAAAGATMVRIPGTAVYEGPAFWDACDRLGLLVWQDAMLATLDPPDDDEMQRELAAELAEVLRPLQGRPSLAVVSGGSETEQQPTMLGLPEERRTVRALVETFPHVVARIVPGTPYVTSSPSGGDLPTHSSRGVAHWFGVGGYLRPLHETRRAAVRFAAECLAFAAPPEAATLRGWGWPDSDAGHTPRWKAGVPRDNGASWDFEDVRDHYVRELFGVDAEAVRTSDPSRYLDLGRAALAHLGVEVFTEWRRPGSGSSGGLVLQARDVVRGAGWGLLDADGRAKSMLLALRRAWAPVALLATDEGLDGLWLHVVNDTASPLDGTLELALLDHQGRVAEKGYSAVHVEPRSGTTVTVDGMLGAFRDVLHAYRFGPAAFDAVHVRLQAEGLPGTVEVVHLVGGQSRPALPDVGLEATASVVGGRWVVDISSRELAQWVALDVDGHEPVESWFHVVPGSVRRVELLGPLDAVPAGRVRALNSRADTGIRAADGGAA